eukprot:scaffold46099_cov191-Amphora_coffeaeformis.AAC.1
MALCNYARHTFRLLTSCQGHCRIEDLSVLIIEAWYGMVAKRFVLRPPTWQTNRLPRFVAPSIWKTVPAETP